MKKIKFKPKPGQIDYTKARWAPVINCVVYYQGKILLVQRSKNLNFYPNYWNGVSGFLDDKKSLVQKAEEELKEELGIAKKQIKSLTMGEIFHQEAPKYKKTWIVHPVLVEMKSDKIKLNWETQDCKWTRLKDAKRMKLMPGFEKVLEKISKII